MYCISRLGKLADRAALDSIGEAYKARHGSIEEESSDDDTEENLVIPDPELSVNGNGKWQSATTDEKTAKSKWNVVSLLAAVFLDSIV